MSEVWVIQAECGDYYCGCGGGHIIGIATSKDMADSIVEDAIEADDYPVNHTYSAPIVDTIPLNTYIKRKF